MSASNPTRRTKWRRLAHGDRRPSGYQYRYKEAVGWTPWMDGDDDLIGVKIAGRAKDWQFRGPAK